jgi:hypothetical protein
MVENPLRTLRWARKLIDWWQRSLVGGVVTSATAWLAWVYFGATWTSQAGLPLSHALFAARFLGLAAEWGGTSLLSLAWVAVLAAAWIGEGLANTPAKTGRRHTRLAHHH